jgi:hypothetical protein
MVGALGMTDSLVSFVAMEEGLNERNCGRQGAVGPRRPGRALPARGGPSLLASRPAPAAELADPGRAG